MLQAGVSVRPLFPLASLVPLARRRGLVILWVLRMPVLLRLLLGLAAFVGSLGGWSFTGSFLLQGVYAGQNPADSAIPSQHQHLHTWPS